MTENGEATTGDMGEFEEEMARYRDAFERMSQSINDLNNLLTVMRGNAQIAYEDASDANVQSLIRAVLTSTERAERILRGVARHGVVTDEAAEKFKAAQAARRARILVVDDEDLIHSLMTGLLAKGGHQVATAEDMRSALDACRRVPFDIIFLDIHLGSDDGLAVFRGIREMLPSAHVVFLSGDPNLDDIWQRVREQGADGCIQKPFDINEIENVVNRILALPV